MKIAEAMEKRDEARKLLIIGIDPAHQRRIKKASQMTLSGNSFEAVTRESFKIKPKGWAERHSSKIIRHFEISISPWIGSPPISDIIAIELFSFLRRIENKGYHEKAHRAYQYCSQVFSYAIVTGRADRDPAADLKGALAPATHR